MLTPDRQRLSSTAQNNIDIYSRQYTTYKIYNIQYTMCTIEGILLSCNISTLHSVLYCMEYTVRILYIRLYRSGVTIDPLLSSYWSVISVTDPAVPFCGPTVRPDLTFNHSSHFLVQPTRYEENGEEKPPLYMYPVITREIRIQSHRPPRKVTEYPSGEDSRRHCSMEYIWSTEYTCNRSSMEKKVHSSVHRYKHLCPI